MTTVVSCSSPQAWTVIFDLGGVLFDWNPRRIVSGFYGEADVGLQEHMLDCVYRHPDWLALDEGTLDEAGAIARFGQRSGRDAAELARLMQATRESLRPIEPTWRLLRALHARGVPLYCLSNMAEPTYLHLRGAHPGWDLFSGILISAREKMLKPQARILELILTRHGLCAERTVFIDDMPANTAAARACGLRAIEFRDAASCAAELSTITAGALAVPVAAPAAVPGAGAGAGNSATGGAAA